MYPIDISHAYFTHPGALRRAAFLIEEAKQGEAALKDHAVTFAMRSITNYAQFGRDLQSGPIKERIQFVSPDAAEMIKSGLPHKLLCSETYNEHPQPLKRTWEWLLEKAHSLTPEEVVAHIGTYPMVLVSKAENRLLKPLAAGQTPEDRYSKVGLVVVSRPTLMPSLTQ